MHRVESAREGRLRAACDRCHDLKNRCVRTGGGDSRCDRCERLDIDCVYRTASRIGRPRATTTTQRRPSKQPLDGLDGPGTTPVAANLVGSPSEVIGLVVSPEGMQSNPEHTARRFWSRTWMDPLTAADTTVDAAMDWALDFTPQVPAHSVYQDVLGTAPLPLPSPEDSGTGTVNGAENTHITDKLLQLQGQLHRLLWTADADPSADLVEESLEVSKAFMEMLQRVMAGSSTPDNNPTGSDRRPATADFIAAQQALTCYSCMLLLFERVVGGLTTAATTTTTTTIPLTTDSNNPMSPVLPPSSPPSLRLGYFSLASQPALNVEVVVCLVLRMVLRLRSLIHALVDGFRDDSGEDGGAVATRMDSVGSETSVSGSPATTVAEGVGVVVSSTTARKRPSLSSIAGALHAVADLVSEEERLLLERLARLGGGRF